ncbi:MAG: phosphoribosylamine--glycine ligase [Oscillospiraceae bacterium]|nr:phosphoribosylamine--glycine ligase [Oscillospiraceae bacterium]
MKILVIGSGGREHAIVSTLRKSPDITEIYAAPGNGGIQSEAICRDVKATDIPSIVALAKEISADLVFVAPDDPLVLGMVDKLEEAGFKTFGPRKNAAILEGSKKFSKDFMKRHAIPTADFEAFKDAQKAIQYIKSRNSYPAVIKCDGLALGKGVIIAQNEDEAISAIEDMLLGGKFGDSGKQIVIEEFLKGTEVTVLAFTDGKTIVPMPPSTDHKRAFDGDKGLNTGGMGVIAPVPYYTPAIADECMEKIFLPTMNGMTQEERPFKGCLYFGLMLTDSGVRVIEYNCRFGDPEAQCLLPLLKTDFLKIIQAIHEERLSDIKVEFDNKSSACVVMASGGYPEKYQTGFQITGLDNSNDNICIYHAGTKLSTVNAAPAIVTSGGRVLAVTAIADDLKSAVDNAYKKINDIKFEGAHYRTDIGNKALKNGFLPQK